MSVPMLNPLLVSTAGPAILEARTWLETYDGAMGSPLDLSQAAAPYPPAKDLLDRLGQAAHLAENSRYGPVPGEHSLRTAYARHVSDLYGADIHANHVAITSGCNQAFSIAAMCVAGHGDEIILPSPWYFNHKMTLNMLGIRTRELPCDAATGFIPDPVVLDRLIDHNVRAVVLTTPNNPTGAIYPPDVIEAVSEVCRRHQIWLILDETYRDFRPDDASPPHTVFNGDGRHGTIGLYSFSKSLAIPGFRLGAMTIPSEIAEHVVKVQDCLQICPVRAGQVAVTWALENLDDWRREKRRSFATKQQQLCINEAKDHGWQIASIGAFFAYLRHPFSVSAVEVARHIASRNGMLMIPGPYFGPDQDRYLRLSFGSLSPKDLKDISRRLIVNI